MKGSYVLLIHQSKDKSIEVGKLGKIKFAEGYYAYVGSAMNNLRSRILRHLKKTKKIHWHIDYLLEKGVIDTVHFAEFSKKKECNISRKLNDAGFKSTKGFGCSDCTCSSHLYFSKSRKKLIDAVCEAFGKNCELQKLMVLGK